MNAQFTADSIKLQFLDYEEWYGLDDTLPVERRVLVVEDDGSSYSLFEKLILHQDRKTQVDRVTHFDGALDMLTSGSKIDSSLPYSLVIADVFLDGDRTGLEVIDLCRTLFPIMPAIVTSAADRASLKRILPNWPLTSPFLKKPFSPQQFLKKYSSTLHHVRVGYI